MRGSGLLTDAFLLHVLLTVTCVPLRDGRGLIKLRKPTGWPPNTHYENNRGKVSYLQDNFIPPAWPKGEAKFRNGSRATRPLRCGVPDYPKQRQVHLSRSPRQRRFVIFGGRWPKTDLTYKIQRFPWQMREDKVRRVMQDALKIWSDVTPLTFSEVINQKADIVIDFTRYWHGDNLPFDGPGGILAHAFFPKTHREGDIHFDYDESWTVGNELGTDLLQVAAHEFGHVLGLQHSRETGAIMSPYYSFSYPLKLSEDDKEGIQYLYGARPKGPPRAPPQLPPQAPPRAPPQLPPQAPPRAPPQAPPQLPPQAPPQLPPQAPPRAPPQLPPQAPPQAPPRAPPQAPPQAPPRAPSQLPPQFPPQMPTETNEIISNEPDACRTDFDAVSIIRGELFFFKSSYVWRIRRGRLQPGYPALASRHWRGIPENIDAAYEDKRGNIWFFEGSSYWMFDAEHKIAGPDHLQTLGLPVTHIQAAIRLKEYHGYQTYFFKSGSYWRLNQQGNRVETSFPRRVRQDWWGVPDKIDTAFQDEHGFAVFISGRQYWKFDPVLRKVLEGYPRYVGPDFFGCRMP